MKNSDYNEELLRECAAVGGAVLAAQRVEFLLYGLVSHFKDDQRKGQFRDLTPESFLRGDLAGLRATLGQLAREYGEKLLLSREELDRFVKNRNLIAHDYWRMARSGIHGGERLDNPNLFLQQFLRDCDHWERILMGVLVKMKRVSAAKIGIDQNVVLTSEEFMHMAYYVQHVRSHVFRDVGSDNG